MIPVAPDEGLVPVPWAAAILSSALLTPISRLSDSCGAAMAGVASCAGGGIGIPGLYVTDDPGGIDAAAKSGNLSIRIGLGWAKSHYFFTGQCPVMKYNRNLMMAILHNKIDVAKAVNVKVITLDEGPNGYKDFDKCAATKFVIDPHKSVH